MTEKELRKLHRQDLLQLLLAQGKETAKLEAHLAEVEENLSQMQSGNDKLKNRLDEKDAQISKLKNRLDEKDVKIHALKTDVEKLQNNRAVELNEIMTALKVNGILEMVQKATDQYLFSIQQMQEVVIAGGVVPAIEAPELDIIEAVSDTQPEQEAPIQEEGDPAAEESLSDEEAAPAEDEELHVEEISLDVEDSLEEGPLPEGERPEAAPLSEEELRTAKAQEDAIIEKFLESSSPADETAEEPEEPEDPEEPDIDEILADEYLEQPPTEESSALERAEPKKRKHFWQRWRKFYGG